LGADLGSGIVFEVAVHLATLVAILIFYRRCIAVLAYSTITGKLFSTEPGLWPTPLFSGHARLIAFGLSRVVPDRIRRLVILRRLHFSDRSGSGYLRS